MNKILKNTTNANIALSSLGLTIISNNQIKIEVQDYLLLANDDSISELTPLINSGDVVVNDSLQDLNAADGIAFISYPNDAQSVRFSSSSFTSKDAKSAIEEAKSLGGQGNRGWESISDNTFTAANPLTVNNNPTTLQINKDSVINSEIPDGVASFWNDTTNRIMPAKAGDAYIVRLNLTAVPQQNNRDLTITVDIGGSIGVVFEDAKILGKGAGTATPLSATIPLFAGSTFIANGGEIIIDANTRVQLYDISLFIIKTYDGDVR